MAKGNKGRKKRRNKKRQNTLWLSFVTVFVCVLAVSLVVGTVFLLRFGERAQEIPVVQEAGQPLQDGRSTPGSAGGSAAGNAAPPAEAALAAFQEFLDGKRDVIMDYETAAGRGKSFYLADLLKNITDDMRQMHAGVEGWNDRIGKLQYAYLDCAGDGIPELALKFVGLDIYSADDDSDMIDVIVYENGKLFCRYETQSWARSATSLYYYGYVSGSGSAGAAHMTGEEVILDMSGKPHTLCRWDIFQGGDIGTMTPYYAEKYDISSMYHTVFGDDPGADDPERSLGYYVVGEEEYFSFFTEGEMGEREKQFTGLCEQAGMKFTTEEEVGRYEDGLLAGLGIGRSCLERREPEWTDVDNTVFTEYIRQDQGFSDPV